MWTAKFSGIPQKTNSTIAWSTQKKVNFNQNLLKGWFCELKIIEAIKPLSKESLVKLSKSWIKVPVFTINWHFFMVDLWQGNWLLYFHVKEPNWRPRCLFYRWREDLEDSKAISAHQMLCLTFDAKFISPNPKTESVGMLFKAHFVDIMHSEMINQHFKVSGFSTKQ